MPCTSHVYSMYYQDRYCYSIIVLNSKNGRGFLVCSLTKGELNNVEDSLNKHMTRHEWMRFLFVRPNGQAQILRGNVFNYNVGDSVYVNSNTDKLSIYRNKKSILETSVTLATMHKVSIPSYFKN